MTTIRYQDVLPLVRAWALEQGTSFTPWAPRWALRNDVPSSTLGDGSLSSPYCAIVLRVLNALADEGVLVKTGSGRHIRFWRPDVHERHEAAEAAEAVQADAELARWAAVRADLAQYGLADLAGGRDIRLSLGDWQRLAGRLKDG